MTVLKREGRLRLPRMNSRDFSGSLAGTRADKVRCKRANTRARCLIFLPPQFTASACRVKAFPFDYRKGLINRDEREPQMQIVPGILMMLRRWGRTLGPYLMLEILLPGRTLLALLLFFYRGTRRSQCRIRILANDYRDKVEPTNPKPHSRAHSSDWSGHRPRVGGACRTAGQEQRNIRCPSNAA
jgi:hypothetical protein